MRPAVHRLALAAFVAGGLGGLVTGLALGPTAPAGTLPPASAAPADGPGRPLAAEARPGPTGGSFDPVPDPATLPLSMRPGPIAGADGAAVGNDAGQRRPVVLPAWAEDAASDAAALRRLLGSDAPEAERLQALEAFAADPEVADAEFDALLQRLIGAGASPLLADHARMLLEARAAGPATAALLPEPMAD